MVSGIVMDKDLPQGIPKSIREEDFGSFVFILEKTKFDVHTNDDCLLELIALNSSPLCFFQYLIDIKGANVNASDDAAIRNASYRSLEHVQYLISKGANINNPEKDSALACAAWNGRLDIVKFLIEKGSYIDLKNGMALRKATHRNHQSVVNYLQSLKEP